MDEPRVSRENRCERRGALLVAFARSPVEEGRAVGARSASPRNPARLRRGRRSAQGRTGRRNRVSHRAAHLFLSAARKREMGRRRAGDPRPKGYLRDMSDILERLADVLESRKAGDPETSYASRLFAKGADAILKKVGEEATETVMAAQAAARLRIVAETADLW